MVNGNGKEKMKPDKSFTFIILSYKQRDFIIEHLVSIQYQVCKFGKGWRNYLLVMDDASKDGTVDIVKQWTQEHAIFESVIIKENKKNLGTVQNYLNALKQIHTSKFKILAADDLYYKNSIYQAAKTGALSITPTIRFSGCRAMEKTIWGNYRMLLGRKRLKSLLASEFQECWIIETPGTFWDLKYLQEEASSYLEGFHYIEDVMFFYYLIMKTDIRVLYDPTTYILYRMGGVSTAQHFEPKVAEAYRREGQKLEDELFLRKKRMSKGWNCYRYYHGVKWRYYLYIAPWIRKKARKFRRSRIRELPKANQYLKTIKEKSKRWEQKHASG